MKSSRANQVEHPANTLFKSSVGVVAALFAAMGIASADNFTTATQQGTGNNWNNPIWNPGGVSPTAGNT